jgi:Uma2 family endonuclease
MLPSAIATVEKITWKHFLELELPDDDPFIYELLEGKIMKRAIPSLVHQAVCRELMTEMNAFIEEKQLGEIFYSPVDVNLDEFNGFQPDLAFVATARHFLIEAGDYIHGAPDLVVEIVSPGTIKRDRVIKKDLCARFGVREYWVVDPSNFSIEIYVLQNNEYVLHDLQEGNGTITSTVLTGFELALNAVFDLPQDAGEIATPVSPEA